MHADDVAQSFMLALASFSTARGEAFHVVSEKALTFRGYAEEIARWLGKKANLKFIPWVELKRSLNDDDRALTEDHLLHSPCASIEKAQRLIGYRPRYSSLEAVKESLSWLVNNGKI